MPRAHEKYCEDIERRLDYRLRINEKVPKEIRRLQLLDQVGVNIFSFLESFIILMEHVYSSMSN